MAESSKSSSSEKGTGAPPESEMADAAAGADLEQGWAVLLPLHALAIVWIVGMLLVGNLAPDRYYMMMQEDRAVEWGTVWLFLAAGVFGLYRAIRHRRIFDGLVALFCIFVAGEEFSWGQRLLGFYSPEYFLANNFQQELNLHNLPGSFLKPKWILIIALAGYGVLLPLVWRYVRQSHRFLTFVGASAPPMALIPWFIAAIAILMWYPLTLTGEWVELFAGALFFASVSPSPKILWISLSLTVVFGFAMIGVVGALERGRDAARLPCARAEVQSLLDDIMKREAGTRKVRRRDSVHKRIWTAINEGYLDGERISEFKADVCRGSAAQNIAVRHKYAIDPWGSPYWLSVERLGNREWQVLIYSFGPNRRRDGKEEELGRTMNGDDIGVMSTLRN